ncbi:MAG: hypothetical protein RMM28_06245, partial [Thermoleophilia bacterium]|nr:hypothetical protein [Thermoleophilia bacterium]
MSDARPKVLYVGRARLRFPLDRGLERPGAAPTRARPPGAAPAAATCPPASGHAPVPAHGGRPQGGAPTPPAGGVPPVTTLRRPHSR